LACSSFAHPRALHLWWWRDEAIANQVPPQSMIKMLPPDFDQTVQSRPKQMITDGRAASVPIKEGATEGIDLVDAAPASCA